MSFEQHHHCLNPNITTWNHHILVNASTLLFLLYDKIIGRILPQSEKTQNAFNLERYVLSETVAVLILRIFFRFFISLGLWVSVSSAILQTQILCRTDYVFVLKFGVPSPDSRLPHACFMLV